MALVLLAAGSGQAACVVPERPPIAVAAIEPRLELRLADGRRLRLVGLDPALQTPGDPDLGETSRAGLAGLLAGRPVLVLALSDKPDRWGRLPGVTTIPDGGDLALLAVRAGLARYLVEPAAHGCRDDLLAAEAEARAARRGLWADPYYGILAVDDLAGFGERSATIVVAEGRLAAVEAGPYRTKLRFVPTDREGREGFGRPARYDRDSLAATIPPRLAKIFAARGLDFTALMGATLRVRGLLDLRFGPQIELSDPDAVEIVTQSAQTSRIDAPGAH